MSIHTPQQALCSYFTDEEVVLEKAKSFQCPNLSSRGIRVGVDGLTPMFLKTNLI